MVSKAPVTMNPWEVHALNYEFPAPATVASEDSAAVATAPQTWRRLQDPIIYPGLYAPSGFNIMDFLLRIISRPNPKVDLGAIDCSVSLVLCDMDQPDAPIVYTTDAFSELTGYSNSEAMGRNCRFLQAPPGKERRAPSLGKKSAAQRMAQAIQAEDEIQLRVTNYKKTGQRFTNFVTIIPVPGPGRYYIGFQVEAD